MATQGERRRQALAAIRTLARAVRSTDSALEKSQRTTKRLLKRKTLIGPDDIVTLGNQLADMIRLAELVQKGYAILVEIIRGLPR